LSYDDFMQKVLEPLPADELLDIPYNKIVRQERWEKWRRAETCTERDIAALRYFRAQHSFNRLMNPQKYGAYCKDDGPLMAAYRQSLATQLRTPCPLWTPHALTLEALHPRQARRRAPGGRATL
jgi:hypothetical protein